jgi:hypothetical protein
MRDLAKQQATAQHQLRGLRRCAFGQTPPVRPPPPPPCFAWRSDRGFRPPGRLCDELARFSASDASLVTKFERGELQADELQVPDGAPRDPYRLQQG